MRVTKNFILVRIDKKMQDAKKGAIGSIHLHPDFTFMERYLQFGEITQIGEKAALNYPESRVGDIAVFHHTIEDDDWRLLYKDDNGDEMRLVDCSHTGESYELFATLRGGKLLPSDRHIFISGEAGSVVKLKRKLDTTLELLEDWDTPDQLNRLLERLKVEMDLMKENLNSVAHPDDEEREIGRRLQIIKDLESKNQEREKVTRLISAKKLGAAKILAINSMTSRYLDGAKEGDEILFNLPLYPIDLYGQAQFFICNRANVLGIVKA